jgi:hypothetical protein
LKGRVVCQKTTRHGHPPKRGPRFGTGKLKERRSFRDGDWCSEWRRFNQRTNSGLFQAAIPNVQAPHPKAIKRTVFSQNSLPGNLFGNPLVWVKQVKAI